MATARALTPRKRPQQERSRRTVDAILVAAAQVLERRGYAGATTDLIAGRAGVSVGSVYQYFPNKDAILVELVERHIDQGFKHLWALLAEASGRTPDIEVLLRRFVEAMLSLHRGEPRLHRVLLEEAPLPAGLRRRLASLEDAFASKVADLLRGLPGLHMRSPQLAAHLVVRSVEGLIHGFLLHPPAAIGEEDFSAEVVTLLARYLQPEGAGLPAARNTPTLPPRGLR